MNGRCDTDPLDVADDVCDLCGGEFCAACLLWPRGHKRAAVCKPCALKNSGIRGTVKSERVMSRRAANKRRIVILETKQARPQSGFVFFDETDEYAGLHDTAPDEAAAEEAEPTRRRISFGRRKHHEGCEASDGPQGHDGSVPDSDPGAGDGSEGVDDRDVAMHGERPGSEIAPGPPLLDEDPFESAVGEDDAPSATETLARIRSRNEAGAAPVPEEHPPAPTPAGHPGFAGPSGTTPMSGLSFDPQIDPFNPAMDPFDFQVDPFATPNITTPSIAAPPPPAPTPPPPITPAPITPPPIVPTPIAAVPRPPAPVVQREAPPPPVPIRRPPEPAAPPPRGADIDANGNWIPPILRGMAPPEERDQELLPRRRSPG